MNRLECTRLPKFQLRVAVESRELLFDGVDLAGQLGKPLPEARGVLRLQVGVHRPKSLRGLQVWVFPGHLLKQFYGVAGDRHWHRRFLASPIGIQVEVGRNR